MYVGDCARANVLVAEATDPSPGPYNIGTGEGSTINALAAQIIGLTGYMGDFAHGPARSGDIIRNTIHSMRARQRLGWAPTVDLREGLTRTIAHYRGV